MRIAEVAKQAGVSIYTVRFYQRRKFLPEPPRSSSNYRNYSRQAVELVRTIKAAQSLGFRLSEVEKMIRISGINTKAAQEMRVTAAAKVRELDHKIQTLRSRRMALLRLLKTCRCQSGREICIAVKKFRPEGELK